MSEQPDVELTLEGLGSYIHEAMRAAGGNFTEPPVVLWHYTTNEAVHQILEHRTLRATDFLYLNDATEGRLLTESLYRVASERWRALPSEYRKRLIRFTKTAHEDIIRSTYVISLSARPDLLSQWRDYGSDGEGLVLGFRTAEFTAPSRAAGIFACRYMDRTELDEQAVRLLDAAEDLGRGSEDDPSPTPAEQFLQAAIEILAPITKDPSYSAEEEYRMVVFGPQRALKYAPDTVETEPWKYPDDMRPRVRARGNESLPYILVQVNNALEAVGLGPRAVPDLTRRHYAVRCLLRQHGWADQLPLWWSKHQYRG